MGFNQKKEYNLLKLRANNYAADVSKRFSKAVNDLLSLQKTYSLGEGEVFSFDDNPKVAKQAQEIIKTLNSATLTAIKKGIKLEWSAANSAADSFLASKFGKKALGDPHFAGWMRRNTDALDAFLKRTANGMSLSDRVWKTGEQLRREVELALSVSIGEGKSASEISREVRQYLKEPDRLFRRVRDAEGNLKLSKAAKAYHPGQGVYRSSYKNAMRLARTETNMAYRSSDHERWKQMDFITGIRIETSHNHPDDDMCDELAGDYPKDFHFTGWHPNCFCHAIPLTISDDDFVKMQQAKLAGEEYDVSGQMITEMPDGFKEYVEERRELLLDAHDNGSLPYFAKDNWSKIDDIFNPITQSEGYKLGQSVLTEMKAIPDVDTSGLSEALKSKDLTLIDEETKKLQTIKDELNNLSHVENGFEEAKTWGYNTIKGIEASVQKKLNDISYLSLEQQAKKLDFEANAYLGGNMIHKATGKPVQTVYPSWEVSQKAYLKELARVQEEIKWQGLNSSLSNAKFMKGSYVKGYDMAVEQLEAAIAAKDFEAASKAKDKLDDWIGLDEKMSLLKPFVAKTDGVAKDKFIKLKQAADEGKFSEADGLVKELKALEDITTQQATLKGMISDNAPASFKKMSDEIDELVKAGEIAKAQSKISEIESWVPLLESYLEAAEFKSKSVAYNDLVKSMADALEKGDMKLAQEAEALVKAKRAELDKKYGGKAAANKAFKDSYEQSRKDKAVWDRGGGDLADKTLFDTSSKVWKEAGARDKRFLELKDQLEANKISEAEFARKLKAEGLKDYRYTDAYGNKLYHTEQEAIYNYTRHYCDVNEPLEGRRYGNAQTEEQFKAKVNAMTDIINTSSTPQDMWFQRGDNDMSAILSRVEFGGSQIPEGADVLRSIYGSTIADADVEALQSLVGMTMEEGGFMSMGSAKGHGFMEDDGKRVIINIFAPKGTKAMYAENFSAFGNGSGQHWSGDSRTKYFSHEFETIAQRGTVMKITKIEKGRYGSRDIIYMDVEIVGQTVRDLKYVKKSNIGRKP